MARPFSPLNLSLTQLDGKRKKTSMLTCAVVRGERENKREK
jgi:hypothetical protein